MRNRCFVIAALLCLLPSVYVRGQERLTTECVDYNSTEDLDRYYRNVDRLLNRKGVFACVVRPSFTNEYSLLIFDDKLQVLTSNTQIWYEKYKPRSSERASIKVDREICTALQCLFEVAVNTRCEYADDRMIMDGVEWVFSNPEGKMASCHSPEADSGTGQLVVLVETIIEKVKDGDNASISNLLHNIQELTDLFCSLQPGPDLNYDNSIISVTSNDGVEINYVITSAEKLTCKVSFKPQKGSMSNRKLNSDVVVIPSAVEYDGKTYTVTRIGERAFKGCKELKAAVIPNTVTCIENQAFYDCDSLSHIDIPESVTLIGDEAFGHCKSLKTLTIPRKVTKLNPSIFGSGADSDITLTLKSPVPPEIDPEALPEGMTIYIPKGSKDSYKKADRKKRYIFVEMQ